jgi:hypothetical protein
LARTAAGHADAIEAAQRDGKEMPDIEPPAVRTVQEGA